MLFKNDDMENFTLAKKRLSFNNDNSYAENKESNKEPQFYDFSCVNSRHVHKNKKMVYFYIIIEYNSIYGYLI